jgi:hypothetical protein
VDLEDILVSSQPLMQPSSNELLIIIQRLHAYVNNKIQKFSNLHLAAACYNKDMHQCLNKVQVVLHVMLTIIVRPTYLIRVLMISLSIHANT